MNCNRLIVNADDFGTDHERSCGILDACRNGIVTSTSIIVSGLGKKDSLVEELTEAFGVRTGIHFNLTFGRPLHNNVRSLASNSGRFYRKPVAWRRALARQFDLEEVRKELSAQIRQLLRIGITPDHIDGNNHIHVFPGISSVVGSVAQEFGIRRVRVPRESFGRWSDLLKPHACKKLLIGKLSQLALPVFREHRLACTDHFAGIQFPVVADACSLQAFLENLPSGTTELMCHPGYSSRQGNPFSNDQREQELFSLTNAAVRDTLRQHRILLTSFSELEQ